MPFGGAQSPTQQMAISQNQQCLTSFCHNKRQSGLLMQRAAFAALGARVRRIFVGGSAASFQPRSDKDTPMTHPPRDWHSCFHTHRDAVLGAMTLILNCTVVLLVEGCEADSPAMSCNANTAFYPVLNKYVSQSVSV